jgi:two-component system KDP operon response regulator KdpE
MPEKSVLVVDDEPKLQRMVSDLFTHAGYKTFSAANGEQGLQQFYMRRPDLILLDVMMPKVDGWELCRQIRQISPVPIMMLTALSQESEIIRGLSYGADDFITKPFSPLLLLARAEALLRRASLPAATKHIAAHDDGYLTIDLETHRVLRQGEHVKLSGTEYRLLVYLYQNAGQVLTFQQILAQVWGEACRYNSEYVHVYISHLRQKLEKDPHTPAYIVTEYGVGYRFNI